MPQDAAKVMMPHAAAPCVNMFAVDLLLLLMRLLLLSRTKNKITSETFALTRISRAGQLPLRWQVGLEIPPEGRQAVGLVLIQSERSAAAWGLKKTHMSLRLETGRVVRDS